MWAGHGQRVPHKGTMHSRGCGQAACPCEGTLRSRDAAGHPGMGTHVWCVRGRSHTCTAPVDTGTPSGWCSPRGMRIPRCKAPCNCCCFRPPPHSVPRDIGLCWGHERGAETGMGGPTVAAPRLAPRKKTLLSQHLGQPLGQGWGSSHTCASAGRLSNGAAIVTCKTRTRARLVWGQFEAKTGLHLGHRARGL